MDTEQDSAPVPAWMQALENKRKRVHRLAHEIGAGSPCLTCGEGCPGLDLHFWRKLCRNCKCKKEDHDVIDDYGYEQFELLLGGNHSKGKRGRAFLNIPEKENGKVEEEQPPAKKVAFDWIPPDVSADLAAEYMASLPTGKLPISGSDGALYRRQQLERQLPLHDLDAEQCHQLTPAEVEKLKEYLENLRQNIVGQGRIAKMPMHTSHSADSLRLPSVYNSVPKPFQANHGGPESSVPGQEWPPPSSQTAPAVSLKPPSAFLSKDRISPIPPGVQRSFSPNSAEAPSSVMKDTVSGDVAYSSVADRGNVFGVTLTPPRSRSSATSPARSAYNRDASPSYLDKTIPQIGISYSSSLPQQQHAYPKDQSPVNSRGASPSRFERNPAPQIGLSHSSALPTKSQTYPYAEGNLSSSRGGSPSIDRHPAPQIGLSHSSALPTKSQTYPYGEGNLSSSRGGSPTIDRHPAPQIGLSHSSALPTKSQTYPYAEGNLSSSRGGSPSIDRHPAPQVGLSHSSALPASQQSSAFSAPNEEDPRNGSPSHLRRNPGPQVGVANSSALSHQQYLPCPGPKNSRDPSPSYLDRSRPLIGEAYSSAVPGELAVSASGSLQPHVGVSSSPDVLQGGSQCTSNVPAQETFLNRGPGDPGYNPQPIGGRVLRDHVPKLYASEATPPGGMYVPVDYLEGSKSKPVDGKLLREPVYGCLATSTIVPEALKVLPASPVEGRRADSDLNESDARHGGSLSANNKANSLAETQNLMQSKPASQSDAMYARVTAHSPTEFELDPQDTLSPQVAALTIDVPSENYAQQKQSEPAETNLDQNPQILLSCVQCQDTVLPGEVVVCADRAGPEFVWHPKCFVCDTCGELLVDLVYFYSGGRVFCGRHFACLLDIPRCKACDELIFVREYTVAEGEAFHVKHFCCFECDEPLADKQYVPHEGHPVCLECYERKYGKKCHTCGLVIDVGKQRMGLKGLNWHLDPACFKCFNCHKSLIGGRLLLNQDQPFCSKECVMQAKESMP